MDNSFSFLTCVLVDDGERHSKGIFCPDTGEGLGIVQTRQCALAK